MRYAYQGTFKDGNGAVVGSGTIYVYLAGTTTTADVYTAASGGSAVNSVTSNATDGSFIFYVDDGDYSRGQLFKLVLSKTGYTSKTYDNIPVWPDGYAYFADPSATDHGATTTDNTIASLAATITTAVTETIVFTPGVYLLDTSLDLSSYTNLYFYFQPGAYLDQVTGDEVLTVYSPENIISPKCNKIFDGDIITFSTAGTVYPEWYGAVRDGSTNDASAIQSAVDAADAVSGVIHLRSGTYISNTAISTDGTCTIRGEGFNTVIDFSGGGAIDGISIGGSDTLVEHLKVIGSGSEAGEVHGIVVDADVDRVTIQHCWTHDWDDAGIRIGYTGSDRATWCKVLNNIVTDTAAGAGIELIYCDYPICTGNHIYWSDTSRTPEHAIRVAGVINGTVSNNYINMADDASTNGITIQAFGSAGVITRASSNIVVDGNQIDQTLYGIVVYGETQHVTISNNCLDGASNSGIGIWIYAAHAGHNFGARNVVITGNTILKFAAGLTIDDDSNAVDPGNRFIISNNNFTGWGDTGSGTCIKLDAASQTLNDVQIIGNKLYKDTTGGNGIRLLNNPTKVKIANNNIAMSTLASGDYVFEITTAAKEVTIENNELDIGSGDPDRFLGLNNACNDIIFRNNSGITLRTTSDGATHVLEFDLMDEAAYYCVVKCIAAQSDFSDRNYYHIEGLFYRNGGGNATQQGATTSVSAIESEANWDCAFGVNANVLRVTVDDNSADTVDWHIQIELVSHRYT